MHSLLLRKTPTNKLSLCICSVYKEDPNSYNSNFMFEINYGSYCSGLSNNLWHIKKTLLKTSQCHLSTESAHIYVVCANLVSLHIFVTKWNLEKTQSSFFCSLLKCEDSLTYSSLCFLATETVSHDHSNFFTYAANMCHCRK